MQRNQAFINFVIMNEHQSHFTQTLKTSHIKEFYSHYKSDQKS